jgi:hypothetical protein
MTLSDNKFVSLIPPSVLEQAHDSVGELLLREYGSVFVAGNGVEPPDRLIFRDDEVSAFQNRVKLGSVKFGRITIELQEQAAASLQLAVQDAREAGLSITPRAPDSGRRSYNDTVGLWHSRVEPALDHWITLGKISPNEADEIRAKSPFEQVPAVLSLEQKGIYFAKDLSKSIIYSVAPPGASQHLSMLAFDVAEFNDLLVREILANHRWYQTVVSDLPHFTYLGFPEDELPARGLKKVVFNEREFWLPDLAGD